MFAKSTGATITGVEGNLIDVEVAISNGLPSFDIIGLPNTMVKEAKERVRTGISNAGIKLRQEKVTVNLAPANLHKDSAGLDLAIAVALLAGYGEIPLECLKDAMFAAEMSLEGDVRGIAGILPMVITARNKGLKRVFLAADNVNEALLVTGIEVFSVDNIANLVDYFNGRVNWKPAEKVKQLEPKTRYNADDFADVQGQFFTKRAFEIAAAGGHNLIMVGTPGSGKTMLARRMCSILPEMEPDEALEVTKIYSIAGLLKNSSGLITERPFRNPHHTATAAALVGGGTIPKPGEITLAHNGVLFLDELPEFSRKTLESLREAIEQGYSVVSRAGGTVRFPARFMLLTAANNCLCGREPEECICSYRSIMNYHKKLSGPFLDRIDIRIKVPKVTYKEMNADNKAETSAEIRKRVTAARNRQVKRLSSEGIFCNAQMSHKMIKKLCHISADALTLLEKVFEERNLSARSYDRVIKVSQTIADLAGDDEIKAAYVAEAIQLRDEDLLSEKVLK